LASARVRHIGTARARYCSFARIARKPPDPASTRPNAVARQPRPRYTTPAANSSRPSRAAGSLKGLAYTSKKAASAMISHAAAATASWAQGLSRRPVAKLAIANEAMAQLSTPSATRLRVPGRPSRGMSSLVSSSGTSSEDG